MSLNEFYTEMGTDWRQVLCRFQSEQQIRRFLFQLREDQSFAHLSRALCLRDRDAAFHAAHALMGLCRNLSLLPLERSSGALTRALQDGTTEQEVASLYSAVQDDHARILKAIEGLN